MDLSADAAKDEHSLHATAHAFIRRQDCSAACMCAYFCVCACVHIIDYYNKIMRLTVQFPFGLETSHYVAGQYSTKNYDTIT